MVSAANSSAQNHPQRTFITLILMNALYFMMFSMVMPYLPAYYQTLGLSMFQIGILASIGSICSILVQPLWSHTSDRIGDRIKVLRILLAGALITVTLFILPSGFIGLFLVIALFQAFNTAVMPVQDAISLNYSNETGKRYSVIRMGGTIGFSLTIVFAGKLAGDTAADMHRSFLVAAGVFLIMLLLTRFLPRPERYVARSKPASFRILLGNRKLLAFLLFLFCYQFGSSFLFGFLSVHIRNLGLSNTMVGVAWLISALSEIPVLLLVDRVLKKHSPPRLLLVAGLMLAVRLFLTSSATGFVGIAVAQCFHGLSMMTSFYAGMQFINREIPEELKASGVGLLTLIQAGLAPILSSLTGGWLADQLSIPVVLRFNMVFVLACTLGGFILYTFRGRILFFRHREP